MTLQHRNLVAQDLFKARRNKRTSQHISISCTSMAFMLYMEGLCLAGSASGAAMPGRASRAVGPMSMPASRTVSSSAELPRRQQQLPHHQAGDSAQVTKAARKQCKLLDVHSFHQALQSLAQSPQDGAVHDAMGPALLPPCKASVFQLLHDLCFAYTASYSYLWP